MIKPLRVIHRQTFGVLAIVLPLIVILSLLSRT